MSRLWRWYLLGYLFLLPMTMVGLVISHVFYRSRSWQWRDGVLTCIAGSTDGETRIWGRPNAQTLGWIEIYDTESNREVADLRVHENVHVGQAFACSLIGVMLGTAFALVSGWSLPLGTLLGGFAGGLGFSVAYGCAFLYLLYTQNDGWYRAYRNNPFEVQAYDLQDKYIAEHAVGMNPRPWGA